MTNEQAIKELQIGYLGDTENLVQAKHIAIKALENQIRIKEILSTPTLFADKFDKIVELEEMLLNN